MRSIFVLNSKGGAGKTTLATNLATFYASRGQSVVLLDMDPQRSSMDWLKERPEARPKIFGLEGVNGWQSLPANVDWLIMDTPPSVRSRRLAGLLRLCQVAIVPVMPSAIDLRAMMSYVADLNEISRELGPRRMRIGTVVNRARKNSPDRLEIQAILDAINLQDGNELPLVGWLRASQNYAECAKRGLGIFELPPSRVAVDIDLWRPLLIWIDTMLKTKEAQAVYSNRPPQSELVLNRITQYMKSRT